MRINGWSRGFRRSSSMVRGNAAHDEEELQLGAALAHMREHGTIDGFPGSSDDRIALKATAIHRGLIAWDRGHERYALSALGQRHLEVYAPRASSIGPKSSARRSGRVRASRVIATGFAAMACLGLIAMLSTGSPWITRPLPAGAPTVVRETPPPPAGNESGGQASLASQWPGRSAQSGDGAGPRASRQTAMAQPADPTAAAEEAMLDAKGASRMMSEAALRLKRDAAEQANKLQQLEPDLERSAGELALILQKIADELAPDADYRAIVVREAEGIRGSAHEAEIDLRDQSARKAHYLQQKLSELETVSRDAEELRTRVTASIDLLERLTHRMQHAGVSGRVEELVKTVRGYLDGVEVIATRTERLAGELDNDEAAIATTGSTPTGGPSSARVGGTETVDRTTTVEHRKHRPNISRKRLRSKIARRKRTAILDFTLIV